MDSERRSLIATAIVGLIVLAIIIGSIYYLVQFIRSRQSGSTVTNQQTQSPKPNASVSGGNAAVRINQDGVQNQPEVSGDVKVYNEGEFQITYPKNWGILTCSNSANVEFDPTNSQDASKVACSRAQKPVTVIKNATGCAGGEAVTIGAYQVVKTKASEGDYTRYEWCVKSAPLLYITHRVSGSGEPASSKEDFSKQVEELISRLSFVRGS